MIVWTLLKQAIDGYIAHNAFSRGAAIAFYVVTSLAPILLIVVAVAGLMFGQDAVSSGLVEQTKSMMGPQGGALVQTMLERSGDKTSGALASAFGVLAALISASGVFSEMQAALNQVWGVKAADLPWTSLFRARAASLGLVVTLGFLLMVSLAASTALSALGVYVEASGRFAPLILMLLNTILSLALFTMMFSAIFKVLPDTPIAWRDVVTSGLITAILFTIGKSLIGWYLGTTAADSAYGAAGALLVILLWSYYSAQVFLLGAEIAYAHAQSRSGPRNDAAA